MSRSSKAEAAGKPAKAAKETRSAEDTLRAKPSQTDAALDLMRSKIIDLTLEPGSRIDEPLLIKEFKLGRTPAREAINRLVAEGLVNIVPNRGGTYVRGLDFREIGEVVAAQQLAESILAQLCRFEDPTLLVDLEAIQQRYVREVEQRTYLGITSVNEEFHLRMHRSIGNSFFFEFAQSTHRHVRRLLVLIYKMEEAEQNVLDDQFEMNLDEHRQIIEAIRKRDRARLKELLPAHAQQAQQRLLRLLSGKAIGPLSLDLRPLDLTART
ncbi:MAG: GntR family transcriptional regulator [Rhizobiales bacterium]|nr:GntR family transcriptional regulator [Hyphomicrobiales bacterium]